MQAALLQYWIAKRTFYPAYYGEDGKFWEKPIAKALFLPRASLNVYNRFRGNVITKTGLGAINLVLCTVNAAALTVLSIGCGAVAVISSAVCLVTPDFKILGKIGKEVEKVSDFFLSASATFSTYAIVSFMIGIERPYGIPSAIMSAFPMV